MWELARRTWSLLFVLSSFHEPFLKILNPESLIETWLFSSFGGIIWIFFCRELPSLEQSLLQEWFQVEVFKEYLARVLQCIQHHHGGTLLRRSNRHSHRYLNHPYHDELICLFWFPVANDPQKYYQSLQRLQF
jgi:hypothetical protein